MPAIPRLYSDLASWYPLLTPVEDYREEAAQYQTFLSDVCGTARTVLELGCGAGHNAFHLKAHFQMTLTDLSPAMLSLSRVINPECEHHQGDMRTLRMERTFDAVFVHDAVSYITTEDDLRQVCETSFLHCRPGGVALFCPDSLRETFVEGTDTGGCNRGDQGLRYLEWSWDPDPSDTTYVTDMAYMMRDGRGNMEVLHDRHVLGLFSQAQWLAILRDVGFTPETVMLQLQGEPRHRMFLARREARTMT